MCQMDGSARMMRWWLAVGLFCVSASTLWRSLAGERHADMQHFFQGFLIGLGLVLMVAARLGQRRRWRRG